MKRTRMKSKDVNRLVTGISFSKKDQCEMVEDEFKVIVINKQVKFFYHNDGFIPTLKLLQDEKLLPIVTVDMGAVRFMVNGADVMRPGITEIEDFEKDEYVVIVDENNKKPLAIGIALFGSEEMKGMKEGKVLKNIHYVGDALWQM